MSKNDGLMSGQIQKKLEKGGITVSSSTVRIKNLVSGKNCIFPSEESKVNSLQNNLILIHSF